MLTGMVRFPTFPSAVVLTHALQARGCTLHDVQQLASVAFGNESNLVCRLIERVPRSQGMHNNSVEMLERRVCVKRVGRGGKGGEFHWYQQAPNWKSKTETIYNGHRHVQRTHDRLRRPFLACRLRKLGWAKVEQWCGYHATPR